MSHETISEIAEREAAEAEAEQPDTDAHQDALVEQAAAEGIEDTSAQSAVEPVDIEAAQRKLDSEAKRHAKRVAEIMGADFASLSECPLCDIPGFVFPWQAGTEHGEAKAAAVDTFMGADQPQLVEAKDKRRCDDCDGWGWVLSGARNEQHKREQCDTCRGNGWVQFTARVAPVTVLDMPTDAAGFAAVGAPQTVTPDPWGRPPGHRDYNTPPALVNMAG